MSSRSFGVSGAILAPLSFASAIFLFSGCGEKKEDDTDSTLPFTGQCERLYGLPNENSGLTSEQCSPICDDCDGDGSFSTRVYNEDDLNTLRAFKHSNAPELLGENPYTTPNSMPATIAQVCALSMKIDGTYATSTYDSKEDAEAANAQITHEGVCGACSSLQDLVVYIEQPDLTTPVRKCGIDNLTGDADVLAQCISKLGFSDPCSQIWAFNSLNTREECFDICISTLSDPYHQADGSPNGCIQCDEEKSGDVFKAVAGRTRRGSGLPTALCRPCDTIAKIHHEY